MDGGAPSTSVDGQQLGAVWFYSIDTAAQYGVVSPYELVNGPLRARNRERLKAWRPYVRLLLQGLEAVRGFGFEHPGVLY